ncbi:MAG: peroxiredoxin [Myxococcota bacterium]
MASPRVGDLAPDFSLPSTQGEISLSQRCKRRSVLLVFYPGDETPVCTKQLCDYQDHLGVFEDLGVDVLAINPQSLESHEKFAANHDLSFPLLCDPDKQVCRSYGALGLLGMAKRALVLVGTDQRVRYSRVDLPIFHRSAAELEEVIEGL